jgi:hypothetical protein
MTDVAAPITLGNESLDVLPDELAPLVTEQILGLVIDQQNPGLVVDQHHGIGGGVDQLSKELVRYFET